jgi:sugar/nucleoside kinase (ribokinase family)
MITADKGTRFSHAAFKPWCSNVKAIDTTAAGDAFNGAFATGLMLGKSPAESARFASAAAAISTTRPGAQPSMASLEETEELLKRFRPESVAEKK